MDSQPLKNDALLREMERRSLDTFMVYNPTDEDYMLEWDRRYTRIPNKNKNLGFGNGKMELPRYQMEKYAREMKDKLINKEADQQLQALKEKMMKAGVQDVVLNANLELERGRMSRTDNQELIEKWYKVVILGLVREYGMDLPDEIKTQKADPTKTQEEQVLERLTQRYVEADIVDEPKVTPVAVAASVTPTIDEVSV